MRRTTILLGFALLTMPLGGCVDDGYGGGSLMWSSYPYSGWYDGYYGSIYDGYWGSDNYFYYRQNDQDRRYHRGDRNHFRRGDAPPGINFHRFEGVNRQPPQGTRMPQFPRSQPRGEGQGGRSHGSREGHRGN